jgi:hypothetical protein
MTPATPASPGMTYRQSLRWAGTDYDKLKLVGHIRGYKRGWAWRRLQEVSV